MLPKKKVLLVNTNAEQAPYPVPPVGLCLVAAALEPRYDVRVFDGLAASPDRLAQAVGDFKPEYIGIGIRNIDNMVADNSIQYVDFIDNAFVKLIRAATSAIMIAGGSGFSIFPQRLLERFGIDYGVVGEGEDTLCALIDALENGADASRIPGVVVRGDSRRAAAGIAVDLSGAPYSEIDRWIDFSPYVKRSAYPIQTKRGCSKECVYCTYPLIEGTGYRKRDPASIADEIEQANARLSAEHGNVTFEFVDSIFNDPAGHAEAVCREIIARNIKVRLRTMGINPSQISRELFDMMKKAGFAQIDCTPDSGSATVISNLRKNFTLSDLEKTAALLKECDMPTMWFFVFGGPGETEETMAETFEFIDNRVNPEDMVYMMAGLRIYPNTELWRVAIREGIIQKDDSLLKPVFYVSPLIGKDRIDSLMKQASQKRHNCVPASQSAPPPQMMQKALEIRARTGATEPMFRTLLRIRKEMMSKGEI